jgi:ADP-ribose pyrophosphatase
MGTRRIYDGKVLALDLDEVVEPGGVHVTREVVRHRGSVAALPVKDDGALVLVRQYRHAVRESLWELPAGRLDGGESPDAGMQRELTEEIGHRAGRLEEIAFYYTSPGFSDESLHVFRATALTPEKTKGDDDERIDLGTFTLAEAEAMVARGEIKDGKTLVAILLELRRRGVAPLKKA